MCWRNPPPPRAPDTTHLISTASSLHVVAHDYHGLLAYRDCAVIAQGLCNLERTSANCDDLPAPEIIRFWEGVEAVSSVAATSRQESDAFRDRCSQADLGIDDTIEEAQRWLRESAGLIRRLATARYEEEVIRGSWGVRPQHSDTVWSSGQDRELCQGRLRS